MIVLLVYEKIGVDYGRTDGHGNNKGYWLDFGTRNRVLVCIVNLYREVEVNNARDEALDTPCVNVNTLLVVISYCRHRPQSADKIILINSLLLTRVQGFQFFHLRRLHINYRLFAISKYSKYFSPCLL